MFSTGSGALPPAARASAAPPSQSRMKFEPMKPAPPVTKIMNGFQSA